MDLEKVPTAGRARMSNKRNHFIRGTAVEVRIDEEGFEGSCFGAKIVKAVGKDKFRIEYEELTTEDGVEPLIEDVRLDQLRPIPPQLTMVDGYNVKDKVDVFHNDGWWEGEISKVFGASKYNVYFEATNEELKVDFSLIRPHQDWIDGVWRTAG